MFRIIRDPSSGGHLHILTEVLQIHGASPYSRHGGCIGEPIVCTVCCVEEDSLSVFMERVHIVGMVAAEGNPLCVLSAV